MKIIAEQKYIIQNVINANRKKSPDQIVVLIHQLILNPNLALNHTNN